MELDTATSNIQLGRYLAGEMDTDERTAFERRLAASPELASNVALMREAWDARNVPAIDGLHIRNAWQGIAEQLEADEPVAPTVARNRRFTWWRAGSAAVVSAILIMISVKYLPVREGAGELSFKSKQFTTAPGQRARIELADGSIVSLSVASSLRYDEHFGSANRDLYLDGEAYFEVTRNSSVPLTVHTGNTMTRVLGTAFGVRKYSSDSSVQVTVNAGKVEVGVAATHQIVAAGEAVRATSNGITLVPLDPAASAWMRGEIVFDNTPLSQVMPEMERWYGIQIKLSDPSLGAELVTATLGSQSRSNAIHIIALMLGARTANDGTTVTLYRR